VVLLPYQDLKCFPKHKSVGEVWQALEGILEGYQSMSLAQVHTFLCNEKKRLLAALSIFIMMVL
jgi:hypothetical protein